MKIKLISAATILAVALMGGCTQENTAPTGGSAGSGTAGAAAELVTVTLELPGMT